MLTMGVLDPPKKLPTTPPKYDTLAGLDGVWYWSDFIEIEKGKQLVLSYLGRAETNEKGHLEKMPERSAAACE